MKEEIYQCCSYCVLAPNKKKLMIFYHLPTSWLTWKDAFWIIWVFGNYKNGYFHIILVVLDNLFFNLTHVDV